MCADFVGLDTFTRGLTKYLNARSYQNAVPDDLWLAVQQQAEQEGVSLPVNLSVIMNTWTSQMGFPLINITRDYETGDVSVAQVIRNDIIFNSIPLKLFMTLYRSGFCKGKCKIRPIRTYTAGGFHFLT